MIKLVAKATFLNVMAAANKKGMHAFYIKKGLCEYLKTNEAAMCKLLQLSAV